MTAEEFCAALEALGWSQAEAARRLRVLMRGKPNKQRVGEWCRGKRAVPEYVAGAIEVHLLLKECMDRNGVATPSGEGTSTHPQDEKVR